VCSSPSVTEGHTLGTNASVFKSGQEVQFSCKEGFSATHSITTCQATGWSPQPVCNIVNCTVPTLNNGHYITSVDTRLTNHQEPYNTLIHAICSKGYIKTLDTQRKCGSGGQWSGAEVECAPITCERLPDTFDNGYYESRDTPPPFPYNYSITVVCDYGFYLTLPATRRCVALNTWSDPDPECRRITCRSPTAFSNVKYNGSNDKYDFKTILVSTCEPGYYMSNNIEKRICERLDTWSGGEPECKTVTCYAPTITNGQFTLPVYYNQRSVFPYNYELTVVCNDGFYLTQPATRRCVALNTWNETDPECRRITCRSPSRFIHGHYNGSRTSYEQSYDFETILVPTCESGYYVAINAEKRVCEDNDIWSGSKPECIKVTCETPTIANGQFTSTGYNVWLGGQSTFLYNHAITVVCDNGYYLTQPATRRCVALNTWSGTDPECRRITCRSPIRFINGQYNESRTPYEQSYDFGTILVPTCEPGHYMSNNVEKRVCEDNDTWSGSIPECKTVTCETPTIANGHFTSPGYNERLEGQSTFPYNHAITVVCDNGYYLTQSATRRCVALNTWSGTDFTCGRITCQFPAEFSKGTYNESQPSYDFGTVLVPTCNTGYYMSNNAEKRVCEQYNSWSGTDPECQRITCQLPTPFSDGHYKGNRQPNYYGTTLEPVCNIGFYLSNNVRKRVCELPDTWSDTDPECKRISCRSPVPFNNGKYNGSHETYDFGTVLIPSCDTGYYMSNNLQNLVCEQLDTWSNSRYGIDPTCQPIWCFSPSKFTNGNYNGSQWSYYFGTILVPTCNTGYYMSSHVEKRVCEHQSGMYGSWSLTDPECRRITCRTPTAFSNGQYNKSREPYDFGSVLVPTCNTGYYMSTNVEKRVCEQLNKWSGSEPVCEIVECETPTVLNGNFSSRKISYNYRDTISIQCDQGYEIKDGSETRTCRADGTWSENPMQCFKILCNDTSDVRHKHIDIYPALAIGENGRVSYNSEHMFLSSGYTEVMCSTSRKLKWIKAPEFGKVCLKRVQKVFAVFSVTN